MPVAVITSDKFNDLLAFSQGLIEADTIVTIGIKNLNGTSDIWIEAIH